MLQDKLKRVTLFMGHYGSGKTNIAVNYALMLKNMGFDTAVYDLDIVNPYFRTTDGKKMLEKKGIKLIASDYAGSNVDIPAMAAENYAMTDDKTKYAVADVGGDDRGALAMGRYADSLKRENNYDMLLVVNKYRLETRNIEGVIQIKEEIERACGMNFTALVNNSNLGKETTVHTVMDSIPFMEKLSERINLKIKFTAIEKSLCAQLVKKIENILPLDIIKYVSWQ